MIHREGKKLRRGESIIAGCRTVPQEISCQLVSAILTRYSGLSIGCQKPWTGHRLHGPFHLVSLATCRCPTQRTVLGHKPPNPFFFCSVDCYLEIAYLQMHAFFPCLFQEIRRALGRGPHLYCPAPGRPLLRVAAPRMAGGSLPERRTDLAHVCLSACRRGNLGGSSGN